ncbi:MAG: EAL domain-containing protein, partial [Nitrosomonas sp.]|nr:EAL domain-containing protein [Nitrosomonas sp.]
YDRVHNAFHPRFLKELEKHQFYDLFLIDKAGNIIYSVYKEFDFATNILTGAYANSGLASAFRRAINSPQESVVFEDFKPYEPSYNKPAAFVATPLFDGEIRIGVLAVQLPIDQLVKVMSLNDTQGEVGLGQSGESYLVGKDFYMRSDSRFMHDMTDSLVEKFATTVGLVRVKTRAVAQALKGVTSDELTEDYRGVEVYSSYAPIKVFDENWAVIVEIDKQEVHDAIKESTFILLLMSVMVFLIFTTMILFLFIRMILKPMQNNEALLNDNLRMQNKALLTSEIILGEYKKAVDLSAIVSKATKTGVITYVNDEFCKISGYNEDELVGKPHNTIRHPDMSKLVFKELWHTLQAKQVWKGVIKNRKKDGGFYYVKSTIVPMLDEDGEIQEFMSIRTDITDLILKEEQIQKQITDVVTLLPNRQKLMEDIYELSDKAKLSSIVINNFRDIEDFYGIDVSNKIIREISGILQDIIANNVITLYRVSGDEFALLNQDRLSMSDFASVIQNMIKYFDSNVITVEDNELNISITVGATSGLKDRLFINSEMALRKAIESSSSFMSFENSAEIEEQYQNNILMTTKIKNAIKNDGIIVFAQLISPNSKSGVNKYECLVRLRDNDQIISPFFFLEVAKKARLYPAITKIVIEKSFKYFSNKKDKFSINLTLEDILNDDVVAFLKKMIREYRIGRRLVIELVESEGIEEYESVNEFINTMKSLGCKIAIDDFGTGYSNFEYLMKLNADYIKIDGSLIKNIHQDQGVEMVVQLIVDFAKRMGIKVIAEYVHNEEVHEKVKELEIDYSQGYYIAEPKELV